MHQITGDREAVLELLEATSEHFAGGAQRKPSARATSAGTAAGKATEKQQWAEQLAAARKREAGNGRLRSVSLGGESREEGWYAPRDQVIALFQAAMDEYLTDKLGAPPPREGKGGKKKAAKKTSKKASARAASVTGAASAAAGVARLEDFYKAPRAGSARGVDLLPKYGVLDPGWATVAWEKAKLLFKGKRKFISHRSAADFGFKMANQTRVAIVGDWGGGNEAAQSVAKQIAKLKPDHVIHLGDVYYAGTPTEVKDRFLKYWKYWTSPAVPGRSLALNSNHEMYSGGYGYFDNTLKEFKQPASYFRLENSHWRLIGLDTGYDEHDLNAKQQEWLRAQFTGTFPKTILLSHHQLFSAYEATNTKKLHKAVKPLLDAKQVYGWIWGHEHLCVVYEPHLGIKAICLGNGCFPYNAPKHKPKIPVQWLDDRTQADPHFRGTHTFALLTFNGPEIAFEFIDQDGNSASPMTWK